MLICRNLPARGGEILCPSMMKVEMQGKTLICRKLPTGGGEILCPSTIKVEMHGGKR